MVRAQVSKQKARSKSVMGTLAGWIAPNTGPKSGVVFVLVLMAVPFRLPVISEAGR
jgi:6-phosphofructokinase